MVFVTTKQMFKNSILQHLCLLCCIEYVFRVVTESVRIVLSRDSRYCMRLTLRNVSKHVLTLSNVSKHVPFRFTHLDA